MDNFYLFIYVEISNLPTEVQLFALLAYHVYNINFAIALFEELLPLLSPPVLISEIVNFIVACSYYWREVSGFFLTYFTDDFATNWARYTFLCKYIFTLRFIIYLSITLWKELLFARRPWFTRVRDASTDDFLFISFSLR